MTKRIKKFFGSLPWCAWCQAGETCTQEGFLAQPWLFPHGRWQRLSSASGTAWTLFMNGTQSTARACAGWMSSSLCWSVNCPFLASYLSLSIIWLFTLQKIKDRKSVLLKYLKYPVKHLSILVLKDIFFSPQQLFKIMTSDFKSELIYYWNYVLKSAKIYVLVRLKTLRS